MTEVAENLAFNQIIKTFKESNPQVEYEIIIQELGRLITDIYIKKIKDFKVDKKLDRFELKKLDLQKIRHTKKGKKRVNKKIRKEQKIDKYHKLRQELNHISDLTSHRSSIKIPERNLIQFNMNSTDSIYIKNGFFYNNKDDYFNLISKNKSQDIDIDKEEIEDINSIQEIDFEIDNRTNFKNKKELEDANRIIRPSNKFSHQNIRNKRLMDEIGFLNDPKGFHIKTELDGELLIEQNQAKDLVSRLKKNEIDEKLTEFYLKDDSDIKDFTKG
ncbi:MAG: hypothetical protein GF311_01780 [Candidatus Lokiarchaeota archaeon]|nr:hypothetical protein [Candidatus Lokiarchaeota archaeon]